MNLDHLRYFEVAAETLHTARAASILGVAQSTISHGIRRIEEELGQDLFENRGRSIVLTNAGKLLAVRAKELLAQADKLKSEFRAKELPLEGKLRVGAVHGVSAHLVAPIFADFHVRHPKLIVEFYSLRSADIVGGIAGRTLDLGICFAPFPLPEMKLLSEIRIPLRIVVRKKHPVLKLSEEKVLIALSQLPAILPKAFSGIEVCENHPELIKLGIHTKPSFIFDSYEVAATYLNVGNAWTLMPETLLEQWGLQAINLKRFRAMTSLALIVPKEHSIPTEIKQCLQALFQIQ